MSDNVPEQGRYVLADVLVSDFEANMNNLRQHATLPDEACVEMESMTDRTLGSIYEGMRAIILARGTFHVRGIEPYVTYDALLAREHVDYDAFEFGSVSLHMRYNYKRGIMLAAIRNGQLDRDERRRLMMNTTKAGVNHTTRLSYDAAAISSDIAGMRQAYSLIREHPPEVRKGFFDVSRCVARYVVQAADLRKPTDVSGWSSL